MANRKNINQISKKLYDSEHKLINQKQCLCQHLRINAEQECANPDCQTIIKSTYTDVSLKEICPKHRSRSKFSCSLGSKICQGCINTGLSICDSMGDSKIHLFQKDQDQDEVLSYSPFYQE